MKKYICIRECFHGHLYSKGDEKCFEDDEEVPEHFELADKEDQAKYNAPKPPETPKTAEVLSENNAPKPPEKPKAEGKPKAAEAPKESKPEEKATADTTQATPPETPKTAEVLSE